MEDDRPAPRYVGFWKRILAAVVDSIFMVLVLLPIGLVFFGAELLEMVDDSGQLSGSADLWLNYLLPIAIVLGFWVWRSATPGKMLVKAEIVDADTLEKPELWQWVVRYIGYYVSALLLLLGFLWVAWDPRKQGFHDKLARTVVIYRDRVAED